MEITLEKIELVKDRTGVTYKEAKETLEKVDGNVVDAIIMLEENVNQKKTSKVNQKVNEKSEELVGKMKEIVSKGNVSRILVKKDDAVILNLPLNAGIVGALVAPWGVIAGVVASFGFNCVIEFVKDDGSSIDLSSKAGEYYEVVKEKGTVVYDEIKTKGQEAYDAVSEKAPGVYENIKDKSGEIFNIVKEKAQEKMSKAEDEIEIIIDDIEEQIEDIENEIKEELGSDK